MPVWGNQADWLSLNKKMLNLNVILLYSQRGHCMGIQKDITGPMKEALSCFLPACPLPVSPHMAHLSLFSFPSPTFSLFCENICSLAANAWSDSEKTSVGLALSHWSLVWATQRPQFIVFYSSAVAKRSSGAHSFPLPHSLFSTFSFRLSQ